MSALAQKVWDFLRGRSQDKPLAAPEPAFGAPRPMTGFFSSLTLAQQERALAYRGPENHGESEFRRPPA
jgi:hypothetical protein